MIRRYFAALARYVRTAPGELADDVSQSIEEEIETHLAYSVDEHVARGLNAEDARRVAYRQFGRVGKAVRGCHGVWNRDQLVFHRVHLLLTGGLLAAAAIWLIYGRAAPPDMAANPATATNVTGDLRGRVLDEHSAPIGQAHILAVVKTWPANGYRQQAHMTTTGPDGSFAIEDVYPSDEPFEVQLAVLADGRLLESSYVNDARGELAPFEFQLASTPAFDVRFRTADGRPIEGVEAFPFRRVDRAGHDHMIYFQSADPIVKRSNARGHVRLPYFQAGDQATVYFRSPGGEWQTRELVIPTEGKVMAVDVSVEQAETAPGDEDKGT